MCWLDRALGRRSPLIALNTRLQQGLYGIQVDDSTRCIPFRIFLRCCRFRGLLLRLCCLLLFCAENSFLSTHCAIQGQLYQPQARMNKYPFRLRSVAQNCAVPFNCAKVPGDRVSQWNSRSRDVFIMCTDVSWIAAGMPRCHITHAENGLSAAFRYGTLTPEACVPPAVLAAHLQNVGAMVQDDPNKHVATAPMPAVLNSHLLMTLSSVSYGRNSLPTTLRLRWTWHVGATVRKIIIRCCSNARLRMRITLNSRKQL